MNRFDEHWKNNATEIIPPAKISAAVRFLRPLLDGVKPGAPPLRILDAGCGDGVHLQSLKQTFSPDTTNELFGFDLSISAMEIFRKRIADPSCHLANGDIGALPYHDKTFDIVYSFGVLAYTSNPRLSFAELCRVTKDGGLIGIWVYPQSSGVGAYLFQLVRNLCRLAGDRGTRLIANCIVPFLFFLPTRSKMNLANANWRQCLEVVLVNIAPAQLVFPVKKEAIGWFSENQIRIFAEDDRDPITLYGKKDAC